MPTEKMKIYLINLRCISYSNIGLDYWEGVSCSISSSSCSSIQVVWTQSKYAIEIKVAYIS